MEELVSVVTPNYNCENYIESTIKSVIQQDYKNWELIIVDDCSTDDSLKIISNYLKKDKRIKLLKNLNNRGVSFSRNRGIEKSQGKYVMFLDSDDIFHKNKISKQVSFMEKNKISLSYTQYNQVNKEGKIINKIEVPLKVNYKNLLTNCSIGCSTSCFLREKYKKMRFKNIQLEDFQFWLEILKKEKYAFGIQESLLDYSIRENSRSSNKIKNTLSMFKIYYFHQKLGLFKSFYFLILYILKWIKRNRRIV